MANLMNSVNPTAYRKSIYKRLFFFGRHPPCLIPVTSTTLQIFKPQVLQALKHMSLPRPNPLNHSSTRLFCK